MAWDGQSEVLCPCAYKARCPLPMRRAKMIKMQMQHGASGCMASKVQGTQEPMETLTHGSNSGRHFKISLGA